MRWLLTTVLLGALVQAPLDPGLHNTAIEVDGVGTVTYGIWVPRDYDPAEPVPLVLALHPGGSTGPGYYGMQFLRGVVGPGPAGLGRDHRRHRTRRTAVGPTTRASAA